MPQLLQRVATDSRPTYRQPLLKSFFRHLPILLVCLAFVSIAFGVSLHGEFPINDDYIYTWSVKHLLETGQFKIPGTVASSIFPIYSGAAACLLTGGFSYTVLRGVSFLFGLLGSIGLYCALREIGLKTRDAALCTAVYLLNPLVVNVCFGFMTDVPALALNNWLLYFGIRLAKVKTPARPRTSAVGLPLDTVPSEQRNPGWFDLAGAAAVLTLGVASRQTVLAFLPAMLILAGKPRLSVPARLVLVAVLVCWPVLFYKMLEPIVLGACDYLTSYTGYKQFVADALLSLVKTPVAGFTLFAEQATKVLCYLGLFCLPLSLPLAVTTFVRRNKVALKIWLPALLLTLVCLAYPLWSLVIAKHCLMPLSENLFCPPAVGTYCIISGGVPGWSATSKTGLTWFAATAAAILLSIGSLIVLLPLRAQNSSCNRTLSSKSVDSATEDIALAPPVNGTVSGRVKGILSRMNPVTCFITMACVCAVGSLVVQTSVMNLDRYYLFALGPAILVLGSLWRKLAGYRMFWLGAALSVCMFAYSFATALDCMSFQRERWSALNWLVAQGTPPLQIDGGPEFNYGYNMGLCEGYRMDKDYVGWPDSYRGAEPRCKWRWWPISSEKYIVSGSKLDGYSVVRTVKYFSPLKGRKRDIYVLKANEASTH